MKFYRKLDLDLPDHIESLGTGRGKKPHPTAIQVKMAVRSSQTHRRLGVGNRGRRGGSTTRYRGQSGRRDPSMHVPWWRVVVIAVVDW